MTKLGDIIAELDGPPAHGDPATVITGVTHDSRTVKPGVMFVAISGDNVDGHRFVLDAVEAGAAAVMAERIDERDLLGVPWIRVANTRHALGPASAVVYGHPTNKLCLVGITGTNGKTTLTFLLESVAKAAGRRPGVVGTISHRWGSIEHTARNTTPEASDLQRMFSDMVEGYVSHVFMEVSSHGLDLGRLEGCDFDVAVFTNLTQDHLDYHGNLEDYYRAKRILFNRLLPRSSNSSRCGVINADDPYGRRLLSEMGSIPCTSYGSSSDAHVRPLDVEMTAHGISVTVKTGRGPIGVTSRLTGPFNLSNILAAVAVSERLDMPIDAVRAGIETVHTVPGRLERVVSERGTVFVDYAHTPNALKNVLDALNILRTGRIITVMGCGGDRDKTKRPVMGKEAAAGSDIVVVTSDNPRTEDPAAIIRQVEEGVREYGFAPFENHTHALPATRGWYRVVPDRRNAIAWAVKRMDKGDILLVAGKGHETYQEINGIRHPFDDREVVREELRKLAERDDAGSGNPTDHHDRPSQPNMKIPRCSGPKTGQSPEARHSQAEPGNEKEGDFQTNRTESGPGGEHT
ncbi:MAG: UDP-N-acetylmuramoyl-L-alanyl-D-glutamate--2,6-diaminopimelate ligase [Desulfomonilaceae bacterium]|nr:UDP-N-acetylmuramoyl-L-alanyl-D-glutamate--2,6-diaminopimelate ligase [Desulfomonilaceae bacterium]